MPIFNLQFLNQFKLSNALSLVLVVVFGLGSVLGGLLLEHNLEKQATAKIASQGLMLMDMMDAVRRYTSEEIQPILAQKLEDENDFFAQSVPTYAANKVYEELAEITFQWEDHRFKTAVSNPTNPQDLANEFEQGIIDMFRASPDQSQVQDFDQDADNRNIFYVARPFRIQSESCLQCHSTPDRAPRAMIERYGDQGGFGWELGSIVGIQIAYIPGQEVLQVARRAFISIAGLTLLIFAIAIVSLNWILDPLLIRPLQYLARISSQIGTAAPTTGSTLAQTDVRRLQTLGRSRNELGQLSRTFQDMVQSIVEREKRFNRQLQEMDRSVLQVAGQGSETAYYRDLSDRARRFRHDGPQQSNLTPSPTLQTYYQALRQQSALLRTSQASWMEVELLLRHEDYFMGLPEPDLHQLAQQAWRETYQPGEWVFRAGDPASKIYVIAAGSVEVLAPDQAQALRMLEAGQVFGEMALFLGVARTASVRAVENTLMFVIDGAPLTRILRSNPQVLPNVERKLALYQQELDAREILHADEVDAASNWFSHARVKLYAWWRGVTATEDV